MKLILVRHGESVWNKENKFTGWTDVELTELGREQARKCGETLMKNNVRFDIAFTSYLKRAIKTLWFIMDATDRIWVPTVKAWQLNERHYGDLQGKNKKETAEKFGEDQVFKWRRSYDIRPPALSHEDPRFPGNDERYKGIKNLPETECLKDTCDRVIPYWKKVIRKNLKDKDVLIVAHGNSLRALIKHLDNISDEGITKLNIPYAIPIVYEFDKKLKIVSKKYIGDQDEIKKLEQEIANQAK